MNPSVDRSFMKDLKNLDKRLGVKWNGENFVVTYDRGHGEPVNIYRVKDDGGGFRQPNRNDLKIIWQGDLTRGEKPEHRVQKLAYMSELMRRKQRETTKGNIRHLTRDNKRYLSQKVTQLTNIGKGNSSVRRIPHKKSKNVVMTIE